MRLACIFILIFACFTALFLGCYAPALFLDRQFGYRDAGHYYYPLNQRVQKEWDEGRWPLWEPEENAGMPLLGNPTAAVFYPGKLVFAVLPYAWAARVYIVVHSALAFVSMLVLMRSWGTTWYGSALAALSYAFGAPILFQYCNVIYLIGAAWLPLGFHAVDRWIRLGRRWGLLELAIVLAMQALGGDPQVAYLLGLVAIGYAAGLAWTGYRSARAENDGATPARSPLWAYVPLIVVGLLGLAAATLTLAQWLPRLRATGKPSPPLFWMPWVPSIVATTCGLVGLGFLVYWFGLWWRRGHRSRLCFMCLGLASAAALAVALDGRAALPSNRVHPADRPGRRGGYA